MTSAAPNRTTLAMPKTLRFTYDSENSLVLGLSDDTLFSVTNTSEESLLRSSSIEKSSSVKKLKSIDDEYDSDLDSDEEEDTSLSDSYYSPRFSSRLPPKIQSFTSNLTRDQRDKLVFSDYLNYHDKVRLGLIDSFYTYPFFCSDFPLPVLYDCQNNVSSTGDIDDLRLEREAMTLSRDEALNALPRTRFVALRECELSTENALLKLEKTDKILEPVEDAAEKAGWSPKAFGPLSRKNGGGDEALLLQDIQLTHDDFLALQNEASALQEFNFTGLNTNTIFDNGFALKSVEEGERAGANFNQVDARARTYSEYIQFPINSPPSPLFMSVFYEGWV